MGIVLSIDGMGGDHAPTMVVEAVARIARAFSHIHFQLYGPREILEPLSRRFHLPSHCTLVHAPEVITADTKPSAAVRGFKDSSMRQAVLAVREGRADGVVSAGNTGAYMALSKLLLGTLEGIDRPALGSLVPTVRGSKVMLDLGANVEIAAENYLQFALMGMTFARVVLGIEEPTIGLLNVGSEELKGHATLKLVHQSMKGSSLFPRFSGFVEGDDIAKGRVDVIVTDGFTGNVALKTMEGTAHLLTSFLKEGVERSLLSKMGALLAKGAFDYLKAKVDPRLYNGAPFLGLKGVSVKSHGGMDVLGFESALKVAIHMIENKFNEKIQEGLARIPQDLLLLQEKEERKEPSQQLTSARGGV